MTIAEARTRATLTVPEVAQLLGIGRDNAYAAVNAGQLPSLRIGRRLLVPVPALLALLGEAADEPSREPLSREHQTSAQLSPQVNGTPTLQHAAASTGAVYPLQTR